jgi:hypothetical protein
MKLTTMNVFPHAHFRLNPTPRCADDTDHRLPPDVDMLHRDLLLAFATGAIEPRFRSPGNTRQPAPCLE